MASQSFPNALPIRRLTRLLADLQTTIIGGGLRCFDGNVDRFAIFSLIVSASLQRVDRCGAISVHSVALSLNRPFETVRRHVRALLDEGSCARAKGGVIIAPDAWEKPDIEALLRVTHDAFVRFVADCSASGAVELPPSAMGRSFTQIDGVQAAVEALLGTLDSNRSVHNDAVDLVLFSTILHANAQKYEADLAFFTPIEQGIRPFGASHAVRYSAIARVLNMPESTVRRRLADVTGPDRAVLQESRGLIVSAAWMNRPDAVGASERSHGAIRRVLFRAAAAGFPFHAPETAYLVERPLSVRVI